MSGRNKILDRIAAINAIDVPLPVIDGDAVTHYNDIVAEFCRVLRSIGGTHSEVSLDEINAIIDKELNSGKHSIDCRKKILEDEPHPATLFDSVDTLYIESSLGVAENGAVWVTGSAIQFRILPFICQHLCILIHPRDIVSTMNEAYEKINDFNEGFGVFIAGPSKTADIEQSLVIGAHGARSMTIYLIK